MELLAVLVGDDRTTRGSCIGSNLDDLVRIKVQTGCPTAAAQAGGDLSTYHNTAIIYAPNDGSSCAGGLG
jgi:hypothetical protein